MKLTFKILKHNINVYNDTYKYSVRRYYNGYYCGHGKLCKNYCGVIKYIIMSYLEHKRIEKEYKMANILIKE